MNRKWTEDLSGIVLPSIILDVNQFDELDSILPISFCKNQVDILICINMIHISPFSSTENLFKIVDKCMQTDGFLLTYGPYRVDNFMVESNVKFDQSLRSRNQEWGIRDLEEVAAVARRHGIDVSEVVKMPSNNLCVVFKRIKR